MNQILQNLKTGETVLEDIPCPDVRSGHLLIRTSKTLVSAGTERMLVEFGKGNMISKARQQPDKVRMVMEKVKTDGLMPTIDAVRSKLDQALPMGYCNVGTVMEVGEGVTGFEVGDRVASNGKHAEVVCVPENLCAKIPDNVNDEQAAFTVIGAIALQGIRLVQPTLGEAVVVTGLGLIGLLAVQLLRAQGCRVLGIDFDSNKLELARQLGAETADLSKGEDPVAVAHTFSRGRDVDAVLITASSKSNEPVHQAALMCRKRGRIVLVGVVGLELSRADFYEKELSFQVSCSYGPGRYDPLYEEGGQDYPIGFVRWTEQRNFEAVLDMLASGQVDIDPLVSHRFDLAEAKEAYVLVSEGAGLGILLQYPHVEEKTEEELRGRTIQLVYTPTTAFAQADAARIGFIGSGNYATQVLIPAFKGTSATLQSVVSSAGVSGIHAGKKFSFIETTTDSERLFSNGNINTLVIATRHDSHCDLVCRGLAAGKHVFVEKPLCLTKDELDKVTNLYRDIPADKRPLLMVGFNRRFSPQVMKIRELLSGVRGPKSFVMTVNSGAIPADHWTQDKGVGGGRIIGEGCHFIDLLRCLAGSKIAKHQAVMLGGGRGEICDDKVTMTLTFEDGSFGTVHYLANGHKSFPKERLEVFAAGRILQLDNFRKLRGFGWPGFKKMNLIRQDKGQKQCALAFVDAIRNGQAAPVPFEELREVSLAAIEIAESLT